MRNNQFEFSVIMAVDDLDFIDESLESLICQSLGFSNRIELILLHDAKSIESEQVCHSYLERYPSNVTCQALEDWSLSAALNWGLALAQGEFINFLTCGDLWVQEAFGIISRFFSLYDDTAVVCANQLYCGMDDGPTSLEYKFDKDKVVNLKKVPNHAQLNLSSTVFRRNALEGLTFSDAMTRSDNPCFIFQALCAQGLKLGCVASAVHYSRTASPFDKSADEVLAEAAALDASLQQTLDFSREQFGEEISYAQNLCAYAARRRAAELQLPLQGEAQAKLIASTKQLVDKIDPKFLANQKGLDAEYKIMLLSLYLGYDARQDLDLDGTKLKWQGHHISDLAARSRLSLRQFREEKDGSVFLNGLIDTYLDLSEVQYFAVRDGQNYALELHETNNRARKWFGERFIARFGFEASIPAGFSKLEFSVVYKDNSPIMISHVCGLDTGPLHHENGMVYETENFLYRSTEEAVECWPVSKQKRKELKRQFRRNCYKQAGAKVLATRWLIGAYKKFKRKEIWVFADRPMSANDNAFALFKYIQTVNDPNLKTYFLIESDSEYYDEVKRAGRTLPLGTFKHKITLAVSDKIISSQAAHWLLAPFEVEGGWYRDFYTTPFTFLQHGVVMSDISKWFNAYDKDYALVTATTAQERDLQLSNIHYGFNDDLVQLTGMARHDLLEDRSKKLIGLMPTWRHNLIGVDETSDSAHRPYSKKLKTSEYFEFYSNLMNHPRLLGAMKRLGYTGVFALHPCFQANLSDFEGNDVWEILPCPADYKQVFSEAKLVISDYSSSIMDFAWMGKPVVYTQFDSDSYFRIGWEGKHFDYEEDGFGPVCYDLESSIDAIIQILENDCRMSSLYKKRVEDYFTFRDRNNRERIYQAICGLDSK